MSAPPRLSTFQAGQRWLLLALLLAAFALRLVRLDAQDIWWDEARNIDVAARPLAQIATAGELDIHPPVYFYLLHGWLRLAGTAGGPTGQDAFAVRFLSLWFGVLFVALMVVLGRRIGGFWVGLGAGAAAAFLPFLLGEAQEARMYTVTLVWLAAAGLAVLRGARVRHQGSGVRGQSGPISAGHRRRFWSRGFSRSISLTTQPAEASIPEPRTASTQAHLVPWLLFALFSALALLTHYAAAFALVALWGWAGLWALTGGRAGLWPRLRTVLLAGLVTALLCLPGLPVALRQIPSYRNPNLVVPAAGSYLAELARVYGLGEHLDPAAARPWLWALAALLLGGWLLAGITNQRISESANQRISESANHEFAIRHSLIRSFALLWSLLPLLVYYLVILDRSTFATRYIAGALPGWLLLVGLAVAGWARLHRIAGGVAALALVAVVVPGLVGDLADERFFREDTRGLAAWLRQETDPARDLILVDQRYPFGLYWPRWNNSAGGFPPAEPADLAPAQYLFVDINTVAERLTTLAQGRERVFWVRWFESDTDPRGAAPFLLHKFGTQMGERAFRGYTVTWYAVAPDTQFELAPALAGAPAEFGGQVRLAAYAFGGRGPGLTSTTAETRATVAPADRPIWVTARWGQLPGAVAPGQALPRGLKATAVLEDADGIVVGRDDRPILNDRHLAPLEWAAPDAPLAVYLVRPEPGTPPGTYTLKLAVYDPVTLAQLPVTGATVQGTFAALGQVTLARPTRPAEIGQLPIESPLTFAWGGVRLLGRGPLPAQIAPGDRLRFDLFWQVEGNDLPTLLARPALTPVEALDLIPAESWEAPLVASYPTENWLAGDVLRGRQAPRLAPGTPAGAYRLTLQLVDTGSGAISPPVALGQVTVAGRPHVFKPPPAMGQLSGARFGELATLLGFDLLPPDGSGALAVILYWQAEGPSAQPYSVSAQLLDAGGVLRAQRDQQPGDGAFPTTSWVAGEVLTDAYRIALPAGGETAAYTLIVKLYDPATGQTLPVTLPDGAPAGDFLRLGELAAAVGENK